MNSKIEIIYSIDKKIDRYVLHKLYSTEGGFNLVGIMSGTYNECRKELDKIKKDKEKKNE